MSDLILANNIAFQDFATVYGGLNGFGSTMSFTNTAGLTLQVLFKAKASADTASGGSLTGTIAKLTELNINLAFNPTAGSAAAGNPAGSSAYVLRPTAVANANSTMAVPTTPTIGLGNGNTWFVANIGILAVDMTNVALTGSSGNIDINGNKLNIAAPTSSYVSGTSAGIAPTLTLLDSAAIKGTATLATTTLTSASLVNNAVLNVANALSFNTIAGSGTFLLDGPTSAVTAPVSKLTAANGGDLSQATFKWKTDETPITGANGINVATTSAGSFTGTPILVVDNVKTAPSPVANFVNDSINDKYVSIVLTNSGGTRTNDQLTVKSVATSALTTTSDLVGGVLDLATTNVTVRSYNAGQGGLIYFTLSKTNNVVSSTTLTVTPSAEDTILDVTNLTVKFHLPTGTTNMAKLFENTTQAKFHNPDVTDGVVLATTGEGTAATSFFTSKSGNKLKFDKTMLGGNYVVMLNKQSSVIAPGPDNKNQIVLRALLGDTKLGTSGVLQNSTSPAADTGWVKLDGVAVAPSKADNTMTIIDLANTVVADDSSEWASVGDGTTNVTINGGPTALKVKGPYTTATELTAKALKTLDLQGVITFNHATALTIESNITSGATKMHILGGGLILTGTEVNTGTGTVDFVAATSPGKGGTIALTVGTAIANKVSEVTIGKIDTANGGVLNIGRAAKGSVTALNSNATINGTTAPSAAATMALNVLSNSTLTIADTTSSTTAGVVTTTNTSKFGAITNGGTLYFGKVDSAGAVVPVGKIEAVSVNNTGTMVVRNNIPANGGALATTAVAFVTVTGSLINTGTIDIRGNLSVGSYAGGTTAGAVLIFNPTLRLSTPITADAKVNKSNLSTAGNGEADVGTGALTGTPYLKITGTTATTSLKTTQVKIRAISGAAALVSPATASTTTIGANTLEFVAIYAVKGFTEKVASTDAKAPAGANAIVSNVTMNGLIVTGYFNENENNTAPTAATPVSKALIIKIVSSAAATPIPVTVASADTVKDSDVAKQVASPARLNLALDHGAISGADAVASTANATFKDNARAYTDEAGYKISQVMANNAKTKAFDMVFSNSSQKDFNTMIHQFSGSQNLSNFSIAGSLSDMVNDGVTRRLSAIQSGGDQGQMGSPSFNLAKGTNKVADLYGDLSSMGLASSSVDNANLGPWVRVAHAGSSLGNTGANNFSGGQDSFQAGFDTKVNKNFTLGFTTAYSDTTSAATGETPTTASFRNLSVGTYGAWSQGRLGIDVQAGMNRGTAKTSRSITPKNDVIAVEEDFAGSAAGSYGFTGLNTAARVGYELGQKSVMSLRPFVGMSYSRTMTDAYTETGSKTAWANLAMPSTSTEKAHATVGIDARKSFKVDAGTVTPRVSLGWKHLVTSADNTETVALAEDQSVKFNTSSNKLDRDAALVGAGVDIRMNNGFAVYGDYNNTIAAGSGHQTQSFIMGGKFGF
ncbi:MAG: autotransporter domain-containing protein [Alphaproteobacteria bacterium]|nr:autotransporter domain-containing protein [Alphaproteobacteria bacterium]